MKKIISMLALLAFAIFPAAAEDIEVGEYNIVVVGEHKKPVETPCEIVMMTIWYGAPPSANYTETAGIKFGFPFGVGAKVYGLELAALGALSDKVDGMQLSLVTNLCEEINGVQLSAINIAHNMNGLQLGVINIANENSFQIGLLNYIEDAFIPWLPILNFKF